MRFRDLALRCRALFSPGRVERELQDELAFHIERETRSLIDHGLDPIAARQRAHAKFGSSTAVADDCRDQRGISPIELVARDTAYALRGIRRAPLASIAIVATVSLGLGVVAVLFTLLNTFLFRVDAVPHVEEMYGLERPMPDGQRPVFPRHRLNDVRDHTTVFSGVYGAVASIDVRVDGRTMDATLVTGNFFEVLGVQPRLGRALNGDDDTRAGGHPAVVLSDKGWTRRFDRDPNVIGRTLLVAGEPFEIVGVMPAGFRGLEVSGPDFWAPLARVGHFRPNDRGHEDAISVEIIGRLEPGITREAARAQLLAWDSNQPATSGARPMPNLDLTPRRGTVPHPIEALAIFTPLFLAFGLILLIGCANVANLLLARGVARQREIGIRLSLGASRPRIVRQLLTESAVLALAAAAGGYLVSRVALAGTVYWVTSTAPVDIGDLNLSVPAADWRVALFLVVAALASTALFALLPALHATRIDPVRTLRGEVINDARPGRARNVLIGIQVFASAVLLICAGIFLRSAIAAATFDPGIRTADTVMIDVINEPARGALIRAIAAEPIVTQYAAVRPSMFDVRPALAAIGNQRTAVHYKFVSGDYFDVIGVPVVRGRSFTAAEGDGTSVAVVSESMALMLWPNGDPIGKTFRLEPDPPAQGRSPDVLPAARQVTVVGVSRDIKGFRFAEIKQGVIFLPTTLGVPGTVAMARVNGDPDLARQTLLEHFTRVDPNMGMIVTMRTVARLESFLLGIAFRVALVLGSLALLLTGFGLYSVVSYLVAQRTREIGVRMALGASSRDVRSLVLAQTATPVVVGLALGAGLAAALAAVLLATPAAAFIGQIVRVADPVAYAGTLVVIVAACLLAAWLPATRAARLDPMQTLRSE